jgi:hypothetical protein
MQIYFFASKVGLKDEQISALFNTVKRAGAAGKLSFFGELVTDLGVHKRLVKIPPEHLAKRDIVFAAALLNGGDNRHVCTFNPETPLAEFPPNKVGEYYNLHVSRKARRMVFDLLGGKKVPSGHTAQASA